MFVEEFGEVVSGFACDDVISCLIGVTVCEPAWEVAEQGVEAVVLNDDGGVVSGAEVGAGEGLQFRGDSGEGVSAIVQHVLTFFEFLGVGGVDVEDLEVLFLCDGTGKVVDFVRCFRIEVRDDGHRDDGGLGVVFAEFCDEGVEIAGKVGGEILASGAVIQAVSEIDEISGRFVFDFAVIPSGGEQPFDVFATEPEVVHIDWREFLFLSERDPDDIFELGFLWGDLFGDDRLGGAVADE